jgi:hypothetical protein
MESDVTFVSNIMLIALINSFFTELTVNKIYFVLLFYSVEFMLVFV